MNTFEIIEQKVNYQGLINTIDIKPDEYLLPLQEVIVNAIQSIEDRKNNEDEGSIIIKAHRNLQVKLDLENADNYNPITGFTVIDNGVGFTNKERKPLVHPIRILTSKKVVKEWVDIQYLHALAVWRLKAILRMVIHFIRDHIGLIELPVYKSILNR